MEFELEWVRPSLLICRVSGVATVEGCEDLMRTVISRPQFRSGISVITDETGVDASALTASDIEQIARLAAQFADPSPVRSAIVAGPDSPVRYGLTRMFKAYADMRRNTAIKVFDTLDEAMAWIGETDAPGPSEPSEDGPQAPL